jgi:integrase
MPKKAEGVYRDGRGGWYVKVTVGRDPTDGRRQQITRRGFATAQEAAQARRELLAKVDRGQLKPSPAGLTVNELLDHYLDGLDADQQLSAKTRFDYRHSADDYVRPILGTKRVRDVTPEVILAWQRKLMNGGGTKYGKALAPNTVRLARAPLAGSFKLAVQLGTVGVNPMTAVPRPKPPRSVPKHWTPEQAREFLGLMETDRTWPIWAFLLGSGLRIGELVSLRWPSVELERRTVRVIEFVSTLGHDLLPSNGKSRDAVRTIVLDDGLVRVLERQRHLQAEDRGAAGRKWHESAHVFTNPDGRPYHPQRLSRMLGDYTAELGLPRLTAHGLRHTSATLMLAGGVPPKVAAERLGHADPTLFIRLYSHVTPTMQIEAAERVGALLFGSDADS